MVLHLKEKCRIKYLLCLKTKIFILLTTYYCFYVIATSQRFVASRKQDEALSATYSSRIISWFNGWFPQNNWNMYKRKHKTSMFALLCCVYSTWHQDTDFEDGIYDGRFWFSFFALGLQVRLTLALSTVSHCLNNIFDQNAQIDSVFVTYFVVAFLCIPTLYCSWLLRA